MDNAITSQTKSPIVTPQLTGRDMAASSSSERQVKCSRSAVSESTIITRSKSKRLSASPSEQTTYNVWQCLPAEILIRIYQCLDDDDRASMARVCKHWGSVFKTPALWRERHFIFAGMRAMNSTRRSCAFISNVGPNLRRLVLECGHPVLHTAKPIAEAVTVFLAHVCKVRKMKIRSFKIVYLDCYHSWRFFDVSRGKLITALSKFLRKQKELKKLELSGAHMLSWEGMRIFESAAKSQARNTITYLHIKDLFEPRYPAYQDSRFQTNLSKFINLKQLYINYIYINNDILSVLARCVQTRLQYLRIVVDSTEPCNHTISPYDWRDFSESCPNTKVVFHFLGKLSLADYKCVFVRCVPMYEIDILSWDRYPSDRDPQGEDMPSVLVHVAMTYTTKLVNFRMACDHVTTPPIDTALVYLIDKCTSLKDVCINTAITIDTVEKICGILKERKPRVLEHLELKVRDLSPDDINKLRNIALMSSSELGLRRIDVEPEESEN